ncbi:MULTISPECIES: hypothetical protein [unclassified Sinorhizobium]|uniref:maleate cis-trans isomerase family protein n=1 Tax=unclassified Sinorhizobium TaxID=2613772 RepID=UPI003524C107
MDVQGYGWAGRVGLIVPPANTTIEPEIVAALPAGVSLHATRLPGRVVSDTSIGLRERFIGYNASLAQTADSFGGADLSALCFGVTGSCYLVGHKGEEALLRDLRAGGVQNVVTAARALGELINKIGARRIALVVPYPDWLTELAIRYWNEIDLDVVQVEALSNVVSIYSVDTQNVVTTSEKIRGSNAEIVVLSGTGVATLPAIERLASSMNIPVISSNLSLAWWSIDRLRKDHPVSVSHPALLALERWIKSQEGLADSTRTKWDMLNDFR